MSLPPITFENLPATDQMKLPFTFGQPFAAGDFPAGTGLAARVAGQPDLPLQVDVKTTHPDGSVRHAVISGVLPAIGAGKLVVANLVPAKAGTPVAFSIAGITLPDAKVTLKIGAEVYTAALASADLASFVPWLAGPTVVEGFASALLKNAQGVEHPLLQIRFGVRYYLASKQARVEFIVENTKTFTAAQKLKYDVDLVLGGKAVFSRSGMDHYHHSRWHQYGWTGAAPTVNVRLDTGYLISSRAVPNIRMSSAPGEFEITELAKSINAGNTGPMTVGPVTPYMPTTGGRLDIGPLPAWSAIWLLSMDKRARDVMMAAADGAGSWSIHYRDEGTGYPVRTDNEKNKDISTHFNLRSRGPLPVPRFFNDNPDAPAGSWSPYTDDTAHQPSLAYLPYLVTGDHYYLEELHFWAASNPLNTDPSNHGHGQGLLRWLQLRGQAWSLRTLGHAAVITPDGHPMKGYFIKQLDNNLNFYTDTYVKGNPNKLGAYDGSGEGAFNEADHFAAWQDDFFTGVLGELVGQGVQKALPLLQWKAKYAVLRMTSPDFPWWLATTYALHIRDNRQSPLYETMGEIYQATYGGDTIPNDDVQQRNAILNGKRFVDMEPCSQDQATVLGNANGYGWAMNRMVGYADSSDGYPANMQPALAAAVNAGIPGAQKAWDLFETRAAKPNYKRTPQWDIIPWSTKQPEMTMPTPSPTPAPAPAAPAPATGLILGAKPADGIAGTWVKVGVEGDTVKVDPNAFLRYGAAGKGYVYAQATGASAKADNTTFGSDPALLVVKQVEVFKPDEKPVVTYKVGPVTRYQLTRVTTGPGNAGSVETIGQFDREDDANRARAALTKADPGPAGAA